MILAFVGPDYIYPSANTSSASSIDPAPSGNQWQPVNHEEVEQYAARYTVQKVWWTVAGKTDLRNISIVHSLRVESCAIRTICPPIYHLILI